MPPEYRVQLLSERTVRRGAPFGATASATVPTGEPAGSPTSGAVSEGPIYVGPFGRSRRLIQPGGALGVRAEPDGKVMVRPVTGSKKVSPSTLSSEFGFDSSSPAATGVTEGRALTIGAIGLRLATCTPLGDPVGFGEPPGLTALSAVANCLRSSWCSL